MIDDDAKQPLATDRVNDNAQIDDRSST